MLTDRVGHLHAVHREVDEEGPRVESEPHPTCERETEDLVAHAHKIQDGVEQEALYDCEGNLEDDFGEIEGAGAVQARRAFALHQRALEREGRDERHEHGEGRVDRDLVCLAPDLRWGGVARGTYEEEHADFGEDVGLCVAQPEEAEAYK